MASSATSVPPMSLTPTLNCSTLGRSFSRSSDNSAGVGDVGPEEEEDGVCLLLPIPKEEEEEDSEYEVAL